MSGDRQQQMRGVLNGLTDQQGVTGASLITRDGLPVMNSENVLGARETFSAMTAALMGAAETAFFELGGATRLRVFAETDQAKVVAVGATEQLLLVIIGDATIPSKELLRHADAAATRLRQIAGGG